MRWTMASILSEFPKDFLFYPYPDRDDATIEHADLRKRDRCTSKHGYEGVTNLSASLINTCAFVRVISSILARIIEGLTIGVLQIGPVWRFRSPYRLCREFVMQTPEPKPHWINKIS